jgi:hypothetical protein
MDAVDVSAPGCWISDCDSIYQDWSTSVGGILPAGSLVFRAAALLFLIFFRTRILILAIIVLCFIFVNTGPTVVFHPSIVGIFLAIGSAAGLFLLPSWQFRKYPHLTSANWQTIFDRDPWVGE